MNRIAVSMAALGFSLVSTVCLAVEPNAEQAEAIAQITKLGGTVTIDEKSPDKAVIAVTWHGRQATDAAAVNLRGLTQLLSLNLHNSMVTDAGLANLKGLTRLQSLDVGGTLGSGVHRPRELPQITHAGLVHLKGLTKLQSLDLSNTKLADAGLAYLKGLKAFAGRWT